MRKICIVATKFFTGGFTSSMVAMIQQIADREVAVDVLLLEGKESSLSINLPENVQVLTVNIKEHKPSIFERKKRKLLKDTKREMNAILEDNHVKLSSLKKSAQIKYYQLYCIQQCLTSYENIDLSEYDCVVSWEELLCNTFLALDVKAKKRIGYIHPDYQLAQFDASTDYPILKCLDKIVCISEVNKKTLCETFLNLKDRIEYVPNVINVKKVVDLSSQESVKLKDNIFKFVTVCRLDNTSKALDRAIRVTERLNKEGFEFAWYIAGEGPSKESIEKELTEKQINNFILLGNMENPYPIMKQGNLFVLQSYYEGRPLCVAEALILEVPVLVTDYASANEQVTDGVTGYIVRNDEDDIYNALKKVLMDPTCLDGIRDNLKKADKSVYQNCDPFLQLISGNSSN